MDIHDTLIKIIEETLNVSRADVRDDSKLIDIAKDSIQLFELLVRIEETFDYKVKYDDIAHIETVGDIFAYIDTLPSHVIEAAKASAQKHEHRSDLSHS